MEGDWGRKSAHHDAGRTEMKVFILIENGFGHEQRPQMCADPEMGVKQSNAVAVGAFSMAPQ